ncbi:peptidoglycan-binding protein [Terrabacter sp. NPDC000476]|uniref:L,D-transpeptidase family protein n=1 Tax=Terrabacter sp. NPDC000476 TaxID=3154258 RepID=UPI00332DFCEA
MRTNRMDRGRAVRALAATLVTTALVAAAPAARADDLTGTPAPTSSGSAPSTTAGTTAATTTATETTETTGTATTPTTTTSTTTALQSTPTTTAPAAPAPAATTQAPAPTTTAPTTTAPSPVVLRSGDTGWAVQDLQARLAVLGIPSGTVDGRYNSAVAAAVRTFLTANDLPGTGQQLTRAAWAALVKQTASRLVIASGTLSNQVKDLQVRLRLVKADYWTLRISGFYGWTLGQSVLAFQRAQHLPQSGVVDERTWSRLVRVTSTKVLATEGTTSNLVKDLQVRLRIVRPSWWTQRVSGFYGWTLGQNVLAFQRTYDLPQSGVLDQRTWDQLVSRTRSPLSIGTGASVVTVRELQRRLGAKKLWPYAFSGVYGWTLGQKVLAFQRAYDVPQSGVVDQRTWARLRAVTWTPGTFDQHRYLSGARPLMPAASSLDKRCRTGRVMCVDKDTRTLTWVVDGKPLMVMWARFGKRGLETREGTFRVSRKYEYVISNLFFTPMPYSMFFSGGQAVHYSSNFARLGYASASHGCVNIADHAQIKALFFKVRVGDKVVVHH